MHPNAYRVKPGSRVDLSKWDPDDASGFRGGKEKARRELERSSERFEQLQERLYAGHEHELIIVLQGMDTSGKDGVIRHVFSGMNPQGVHVASFKTPSVLELDHDYLWRIHREAPRRGEITIFNRSHYEDVLVVRVHETISAAECRRRYRHINDFERMLVEEGTTILKFFLHVSKDEQKRRLRERLADPEKHWKFSESDVRERRLWDDYLDAYEKMLSKTSTAHAPWHIVPANKKWYRNLVVARVIAAALEDLGMEFPKARVDLESIDLD